MNRFHAFPVVIALMLLMAIAPDAAAVTITEYPLPTAGNNPVGITSGPDGNLWFTEGAGGFRIGRIIASGAQEGSITEYPIPTFSAAPWGIVTGSDGNVWFVEESKNKIGRIVPSGPGIGAVADYATPTGNSAPESITSGADGNLWFTESDQPKIGTVAPSHLPAPLITEYSIPSGNGTRGITAGPDGNVWFTEDRFGNRIGKITPSGIITEYLIPTPASTPRGIALGPDGNLWFVEQNGNKIGRITPGGVITEFPIPTESSGPLGITGGSDGNVWFTEQSASKIGRITPEGVITEYPLPGGSGGPWGITSGPDGNIWFTEFNGNKIGKVTIAAAYTGSTATGTGDVTATFSNADGCAVTKSQFDSAPPPPPGVVFPHGIFGFTVAGCAPGSRLGLSLAYPAGLPAGTRYWNFGGTPDNHAPHWYVVAADVRDKLVTFPIVDGGLGDDDLSVDSSIISRGGPGVPDGSVAFNVDVDSNSSYEALTDGLLMMRYLFGLSGQALTFGAVGAGANRPDATALVAHLNDIRPLLDVDANGRVDALTDGLLLLRYLFGLRGDALISGAIGSGATRTGAPQIAAFIQSLMSQN